MKQLFRKTHLTPLAFLLAIFSVAFLSSMLVNAQGTESGYQLLAPIPTIDKTSGITLVDYMKGVFVATIGLAIVLAVIELVVGGIEYVAAAVPSAKEDAKKRIGGAVGGLLLILLAWVLLQALNPKLLNVGLNLEKIAVTGQASGGGGVVAAQQWCRVGTITGQVLGSPFNSEADCKAAATGLAESCKSCSTGGVGGARCSPINDSNNPCSVSNLQGKFGGNVSKATNASTVCHWESSGRPAVGGDFTTSGVPVSFGLFQINLSAPPKGAAIGGITNCPSAFSAPYTGSNHNITVVDQDLYNRCKAAAQNPDNNIQTMIDGSNNGTSWGPWTGAKKCGI